MRRLVDEQEAGLRPPEGLARGQGQIEWERQADGHERLRVRFAGLGLPDGAYVSIRLGGAILGYARLASGAGGLSFETRKGQVPKGAAGQLVEVVHGEAVVLRGLLEPA
jgi:hypothetical protein